jgi:glutamate-1-semialdehyde 2,1-aminomutase
MGPADRPHLVADSAGIPQALEQTMLLLPFEESAFELIEEHASELAVVMIEPVLGGWMLPGDRQFLERLRQVTRRAGVLLLFDEVITGFRLALGGAQEYYDVIPDMATYGKTIGGGMPIGAVAGSREIMDAVTQGEFAIRVAGTYSGNPMTLAAGNAFLDFLLENPQIYAEIAAKGDSIRSSVNELCEAKGWPATMTGVGSLCQVHLTSPPVTKPRDLVRQDGEALRDFQLFLRLNGIFVPRVHLACVSSAHSDEDVEEIIRAHQISLEACIAVRHEA